MLLRPTGLCHAVLWLVALGMDGKPPSAGASAAGAATEEGTAAASAGTPEAGKPWTGWGSSGGHTLRPVSGLCKNTGHLAARSLYTKRQGNWMQETDGDGMRGRRNLPRTVKSPKQGLQDEGACPSVVRASLEAVVRGNSSWVKINTDKTRHQS